MPEPADGLADRIAGTAGLAPLLRDAQAVWRARAANAPTEPAPDSDGDAARTDGPELVVTPGWRSFEDAFPTFYQFTNRPR